ncbi:UDP-N-acetylmuramoyl-tripeptide--D-alanyl-D-alanine ligase [Cryptosporangium aurantiacum]|uniref:UDP-N-acetylmuramoyl-tripeptide--D-alanyl-D-alanine ligase n=1 Tax=Cryptosporangium aurantiacum TaxID=134849 RepID=A0A1M7I4C9_9ACTN|nr:UDP-N-acetylmuramoyl-tripeptide--D-alanyl-D-alanine ligase [Cryptosporangium aurantiacum]SHM35641.1 UDP-N-acetylmuramoyl-tripeptide--D-alanyl-D-alanine ligase [Cryptosporangium aurantiacum]
MIPLTLAEVAAATGGDLRNCDPATVVTGTVEYDSRSVTRGGLFVALAGERVDGHDFAAGAVEAGAVAVLATRPVGDVPTVLVDDALVALGKLARAVVDRLPELTIVGVTGSSGKTSTKDLLAAVVSRLGPTVAPPGSFNNELGHPWTVLRADEHTRYLVLEKSARGVGHIHWLTEIAPPRIGVVLNVGAAHVGEFGSVEVTAQAKGELVEALSTEGVAVLNADDPRVRAMASRTKARVVLVGLAPDAGVRATDVTLDALGRPGFTIRAGEDSAHVQMLLHGEHHVGNALAAAAVGLELGLSLDDVAAELAAAVPVSRRRMEVTERADGVTIVDDSYNANPDSVRAALKALRAMATPAPNVGEEPRGRRRVWAVLGVMAELGESSREQHDAIGRLAVRLDIDRLVVVGTEAGAIHAGAVLEGSWGEESVHVPDVDAAVRLLTEQLAPGDVVLVKASRSARLDRVVDALLAAPVAAAPGAGGGHA